MALGTASVAPETIARTDEGPVLLNRGAGSTAPPDQPLLERS